MVVVVELMDYKRAFASEKTLKLHCVFFFFDLDLHFLAPRFSLLSHPRRFLPLTQIKTNKTDEDVKNSKFTNPHKGH